MQRAITIYIITVQRYTPILCDVLLEIGSIIYYAIPAKSAVNLGQKMWEVSGVLYPTSRGKILTF
jgi:hypothetical protein